MNIILEILAAAGPIGLAVMGAIVTISPPDEKLRILWIIGFIVVGIVSMVAALKVRKRQDAEHKRELANLITGGDHYCYLTADPDDLKANKDEIGLWITSTGTMYDANFWITPASTGGDHKDPDYWERGQHLLKPLVYQGGPFYLGKSVKPGDYRIQYNARNGGFSELLRIRSLDGKLVQLVDVVSVGGNKRLKQIRPDGYVESDN